MSLALKFLLNSILFSLTTFLESFSKDDDKDIVKVPKDKKDLDRVQDDAITRTRIRYEEGAWLKGAALHMVREQ